MKRFVVLTCIVMFAIFACGCSRNPPHARATAQITVQSSRCISDLQQLGSENLDNLLVCYSVSSEELNRRIMRLDEGSLELILGSLSGGVYTDAAIRYSPCVVDLTQLKMAALNDCNLLAGIAVSVALKDT